MKRLIVTLLLFAAGVALLSDAAHSKPKPAFDELIVFGDSSVDTGNLHILTGGVVAAPPFYGGRISNGPVWVEHVAEEIGLGSTSEDNPLPAPSLDGGTNYAYAGAEAGDGPSEPCITFPGGQQLCFPTVGLQIEYFQDDGRTLDGDELIVIAGGYNDPSGQYAAHQIAGHIETLYDLGGRSFLVPNMFRISQAPTFSPDDYYDEFVEQFNETIQAELDDLEASLDGITIYRVDFLGLSDDIIANPEDYGLTNVTDDACPGCIGGVPAPDAEETMVDNPDEYMWFAAHPSATLHEILGLAAADVVLSGS